MRGEDPARGLRPRAPATCTWARLFTRPQPAARWPPQCWGCSHPRVGWCGSAECHVMTPGAQSTLGPTDRWGALRAGMGGPWRVGTQRQLLRSRCQLLLITQPVGSTSTGGSLGPARGPRCQAPARSQEPLASATGRAAHAGGSLPGRAPARRRSAWWNARFVRTPAVHLAGAPAPQGRCGAAQGNPEAPPPEGGEPCAFSQPPHSPSFVRDHREEWPSVPVPESNRFSICPIMQRSRQTGKGSHLILLCGN